MSKRTYQLVTIQPDGTTTDVAFEKRPDLKALQAAVGGYIESVKVRYEGKIREAYANEEGLIHGLEFNWAASAMAREFGYDGLVGPVAIIVTVPGAKS